MTRPHPSTSRCCSTGCCSRRCVCTPCRSSTPRTRARGPRTSCSSTYRSGCCTCCCARCRGRETCCSRVWLPPWRWPFCSPASASSSTTAKPCFLNPKVVAANEYDNYFRVNSLFFDPSIYGRFLALVMIAVTTVVLWSREKRTQLWGAADPRLAAGRARHELLAVEYRGAAARACDPGRLALGRARHDLCVGRAGGDRGGVRVGGAVLLALRAEGCQRLGQQCD